MPLCNLKPKAKGKAGPRVKLGKKTKTEKSEPCSEALELVALGKEEAQEPAADVDQGTQGGGRLDRPSMARSHSELAGARSLGALMPAVNSQLHAAIEQDINTIMDHPVFNGIRFCPPLQIDENATEADCGYKAMHVQLPKSVSSP